MRVLVTGAGGFIGRVLVQRLLAHGLGGRPVDAVVACDLSLQGLPADPRLHRVAGSIADAGVLEQALAQPVRAVQSVQTVFHLASVPGGAAEQDPVLGRRVNLDATLRLVDLLRDRAPAAGPAPQLVFASTVAVYGDPLPAVVDDDTPARPAMSYGAHKLAAEILLADASRRGWIDACSLRLPGVVARPGDGAGLVSAFMSQLFWKLRDGVPIVLPVSADGSAWWISVGACVDNLLHAATLPRHAAGATCTLQMPALQLTMQQVVDALARRHGQRCRALVRYEPREAVQRLFASFPPLHTPRADALGLRHDGSADGLVARALAGGAHDPRATKV